MKRMRAQTQMDKAKHKERLRSEKERRGAKVEKCKGEKKQEERRGQI